MFASAVGKPKRAMVVWNDATSERFGEVVEHALVDAGFANSFQKSSSGQMSGISSYFIIAIFSLFSFSFLSFSDRLVFYLPYLHCSFFTLSFCPRCQKHKYNFFHLSLCICLWKILFQFLRRNLHLNFFSTFIHANLINLRIRQHPLF